MVRVEEETVCSVNLKGESANILLHHALHNGVEVPNPCELKATVTPTEQPLSVLRT